MHRHEFLRASLIIAVALAAPRLSDAAPQRRPNVVILLADDLGYADISLHGCRDLKTPNIDALGRDGVRCSSGYVTAPVCSPSRAGLLTGRYQQRWGHWGNGTGGLPAEEVTIAEVLKANGYATGIVGKWHLGGGARHPLNQGFDEAHALQWVDMVGKGKGASQPDPEPKIRTPNPAIPPGADAEVEKYEAIRRSRIAADFIARHRARPFFLYVAYFAPHQPYNPPKTYVERLAQVASANRRDYLASVAALDDGVGIVLKQLRDLGLEKDTLVVFLSDNGGHAYEGKDNAADNKPLRGGKLSFYEGGIRVPFLVRWPGVLRAAGDCAVPVSALDVFPTVVAAVEGRLPDGLKLDGVDILPQLKGESTEPAHAHLFWKGEKGSAVRVGNYKLVVRGKRPELFDLSRDPGESTDLATREPARVQDLQTALDRWAAQMAVPASKRPR